MLRSELLTWYTGNLSAFCFRIAGARPRSAFEAEYRKTSCWFLFNASQSDSTTRDRGAVRRSRSNSGAANRQRKTQEADRFWFAPRGDEKGRQWLLRTRRSRTMRRSSSISSNSGAANPQRKTQKADRFWFAPGRIKPNPSTISQGVCQEL